MLINSKKNFLTRKKTFTKLKNRQFLENNNNYSKNDNTISLVFFTQERIKIKICMYFIDMQLKFLIRFIFYIVFNKSNHYNY